MGQPAGTAAGRGAVLLAVAVALGIVLLNAADDAPSGTERVVSRDVRPLPTVATDGPSTTTALARAPKDVKVLAANATRVKGAGAKVTDTLRQAGYDVLSPTDAPKSNSSTAYYVTGYDRDAAAVATVLGLAPTAIAPMPTPPPISDSRGANVLVIIGPELAGGTGESSTPSTTRRTTSTTRGSTTTSAKASSTSSTTAKPSTTSTTSRRTSTTTSTTR